MRNTVILLGLLLSAGHATAALPAAITAGEIINVELSQLHPTQSAIGYRELDYKLHRYQHEPKKLFNDFCASAGQRGVKTFDAQSRLSDRRSFTCKAAPGSDPDAMKTVVIAPDNALYLTDGHHTFSNFADIGGLNTQVPVRITDDYRQLKTMSAFWDTLKARHQVWLDSASGQLQPAALPTQLGRHAMQNDEYRSLVYFANKVGYVKRSNALPFLEFYWGEWLAKQLPLSGFDLTSSRGYARAVAAAAEKMTTIPPDTVIANTDAGPVTAQAMGALQQVNSKAMHKLVSSGGKLRWAFAD